MHFVVEEERRRGDTCNFLLFIFKPFGIGCCWDLSLTIETPALYVNENFRALCKEELPRPMLRRTPALYVKINFRSMFRRTFALYVKKNFRSMFRRTFALYVKENSRSLC